MTDFCTIKDFFKKWNARIFFIFKARLFIFWVIGHANDLVAWYDCHNDQTRLNPVLGCGIHENIMVKYPMTDRVNLHIFMMYVLNIPKIIFPRKKSVWLTIAILAIFTLQWRKLPIRFALGSVWFQWCSKFSNFVSDIY